MKKIIIGKKNEVIKKRLKFSIRKSDINRTITIKAVLWDNARLDLEAILRVEKGAKNTNTYLKIDCLLMSENASARVIPSLEIMEDAVKSGHGATISTIDKIKLNYLQSRGLSIPQAEKLIVQGFLK